MTSVLAAIVAQNVVHQILDFEMSLHDNQQGYHESKMKYLAKSVEDCGSPEKQVTDLPSRHKSQGWRTQLCTARQTVALNLGCQV